MKYLLTIACVLMVSAGAFAQSPKPIILGQSYEMKSAILSETRQLNVYFPDGYNEKDTTHYNVIYLLDGGMDEDFVHIVGLVQFNTFPWIARVPNSIIVGVVNVDRKRDMTFPTTVAADKKAYPTTGGSAKFISFIEKELQPWVNSHFKTNSNATLIGESLGGLLATEILYTKPSLFNYYIIVSPSLWWDNGSMLKRNLNLKDVKRPTVVYIAVGKEGLAPSEVPHVMEVDANVLKDKIDEQKNSNIKTWLDYLPEETHATIGHHAVFDALRVIYGGAKTE